MRLVVFFHKTTVTLRFLYVCVGNIILEKYCFYPFEHYLVYLCNNKHIITTTLLFSRKKSKTVDLCFNILTKKPQNKDVYTIKVLLSTCKYLICQLQSLFSRSKGAKDNQILCIGHESDECTLERKVE